MVLSKSSRSLGSDSRGSTTEPEPRERSRQGRRSRETTAADVGEMLPEDAETLATREQLQCLGPLNLRSLPGGLTSVEFRPLWLAILEIIDEEPRLEQRARTVAAQLSHREIAYAIIGLQLALMQAADTMTLILEERLQYEDTHREAEEEIPEAEHQPREDSEEEAPVDEPELEEMDATAMPPRQTNLVDPLWKALSGDEKRRLQASIQALLPTQDDPEPSLTLLAMTGASPMECQSNTNNSANVQVAMGALRAPLIRWLRTSPQSSLPEIIRTVLALPGVVHPDQEAMQAVACKIQETAGQQPESEPIESLLRHWSDTSDTGVVEEVLRLLARGKWRTALQEALHGDAPASKEEASSQAARQPPSNFTTSVVEFPTGGSGRGRRRDWSQEKKQGRRQMSQYRSRRQGIRSSSRTAVSNSQCRTSIRTGHGSS